MDPESNKPKFCARSCKVFSAGELQANDDSSKHFKESTREVVNQKPISCIDHFKQKDGHKISAYQFTTHASLNLEHWPTSSETKSLCDDLKDMNFSSFSSSTSRNIVNKETTVNISDGDPKFIDPNQIGFDGPSTFMVPPDCRLSDVQPRTPSLNDKAETTGWFLKEDVVLKSNGRFSNALESEQIAEEKKHVQNQWPKLFSDEPFGSVDQECSVSDICDDETFFSIRSGSCSRSSSPISFDENTDAESCLYEEALEDFSSYSVDNQMNLEAPSCLSAYAGQLPVAGLPSFPKIKSSVNEMKSKHRKDVSCNTDFTCSKNGHENKETQTKNMDIQNLGVNTERTQFEIVSPTQDAVHLGVDHCTDLEHNKGNKIECSHPLHEPLLQRAVKAEMQLVDVQRWMCWQLCWKTQQQYMEKRSLLDMQPTTVELSPAMMNFDLLSALAEVEEKYSEMKTQIQSGLPLDALVPLSMQLTKIGTPPGNLLNQCFTEHFQCSTIEKVSSDHHEDLQNIKSQRNDFTKVQHSEERDFNQSKKFSKKETSYVHVGNVEQSVKEVELRAAFQRFDVSKIFIEESSMNSSYALLIFTCSKQAQAAVKEMDGKFFRGKKLKVRHIQQSGLHFQFASDAIKTFSAPLCQGKAMVETGKPKEGSASRPPESVSFMPKSVTQSEVPKGHSMENIGDLSSDMPNKIGFPNASPAFAKMPRCSSTGFSRNMLPANPWMLQSHHSQLGMYNSMPKPVLVPYSYPLYATSEASPFTLQTHLRTPLYKPSVKMNSNALTLVKDKVSEVPPPSQNSTRPLSDSIGVLNQDNNAGTRTSRKTPSKPVIESVSSTLTKSKSEIATSASSLHSSSTVLNTATTANGANITTSFPLVDDMKTKSLVSSSFKPAEPLRFPMFVPESVTMPEECKTPIGKKNTSDGVTQPSICPRQTDSALSREMMWGVYPKLDQTSELPTFFIPNRLNLSQFKKVVNYLSMLHKNATRDEIVDALQEVRMLRGGSLGGLTISKIISQVSSVLAVKRIPPA